MAGDWIKMRADLFEHPKVFKLADALGVDEFSVVGMLFCFWAWADKHSVDGRVDAATSRLVDSCAHKQGFANAMVSVGWLSVDDSGITIPRFNEHNGDSAKERSLKNQRQARWRAGKKDADVDEQPSTSPPTKASTREEKRREERDTPLPPAGGVARFEDFWEAWPKNERKQDKVKCAKKWKASAFDLKADLILADIAVKRQTQKWQDGFVEAPLVYLNGKRWEDGVTPGGSTAQASIMSGVI